MTDAAEVPAYHEPLDISQRLLYRYQRGTPED